MPRLESHDGTLDPRSALSSAGGTGRDGLDANAVASKGLVERGKTQCAAAIAAAARPRGRRPARHRGCGVLRFPHPDPLRQRQSGLSTSDDEYDQQPEQHAVHDDQHHDVRGVGHRLGRARRGPEGPPGVRHPPGRRPSRWSRRRRPPPSTGPSTFRARPTSTPGRRPTWTSRRNVFGPSRAAGPGDVAAYDGAMTAYSGVGGCQNAGALEAPTDLKTKLQACAARRAGDRHLYERGEGASWTTGAPT